MLHSLISSIVNNPVPIFVLETADVRITTDIVDRIVPYSAPAGIHVFCDWLAKSPPPNPNIFHHNSSDDCLVNEDSPLFHGVII
uniref:Uncharacterized protein n=2 Tax=Physcomitrium patens TaxID=3218 RepID=A0A2K1J3B0_PHYPA|nr:hypothetical protein PHYPA_021865 [Physcomitrium patens]